MSSDLSVFINILVSLFKNLTAYFLTAKKNELMFDLF